MINSGDQTNLNWFCTYILVEDDGYVLDFSEACIINSVLEHLFQMMLKPAKILFMPMKNLALSLVVEGQEKQKNELWL